VNIRPGPDAASSRLEAGKVWGRCLDHTPRSGLAEAGNRVRVGAPVLFTASEASGVYVGRPKNCCDEPEGLLQGGNGTRIAVMRKFPAISHTLVRPPNPEPYQGSPDAAASGFQRCKKERPIHQDHLLVGKFFTNNKREPARNQGIFSRPADLETWRGVASGFTSLKRRPSGQSAAGVRITACRLPFSLILQYNPGKICTRSRRP